MAKGEAGRINELSRSETNYDHAIRNDELNHQRARREEAQNRSDDLYNTIVGGYTDLATNGGITDEDRARQRQFLQNKRGLIDAASGGGGADYSDSAYRGVDLTPLNELEALFRDSIGGKTIDTEKLRSGRPYVEALAKNGGYDPAAKESIGADIGLLKGIAGTGGISDEGVNRMRGAGVFDEFAETGGLSDMDKSMLRKRGNSGIAGIYSQLKNDASKMSRVGNSTAGLSALNSRLGRDAARTAQSAALDTELGITDRTLEGRRWGATSMANAESGVQDLQSSNRMNALNSSIANQRGIQEFMSSMGLDAGKWLSESEIPIQDRLTDERRYGIGGLDKIIQQRIAENQNIESSRASAAGASASSRQASMEQQARMLMGLEDEGLDLEKYFMEFGREGRFGGLEGLGRLRESVPGELAFREGLIQQNQFGNQAGSQANIRQQQDYNPNRSVMDNVGQALGIAGNVAGAIGGLTNSFGGGGTTTRRRPTDVNTP